MRYQKFLIKGVTYFITIFRKLNSNSVEDAWEERNERTAVGGYRTLWNQTERPILERRVEGRLT